MKEKIKIIITGGSGFIGTNLINMYINNCNYEILNIDIKEPKIKEHYSIWENVDITHKDKLSEVITNFLPDYVYHLAARTDLEGKTLDDYSANIEGVKNVIDALNNIQNLKKVFFASSKLVCRNGYIPNDWNDYCPDTVYGESKQTSEEIIKASQVKFKYIIGRITSIWGPYFDSPYRDFFDIVMSNKYFHPFKRELRKTYGYVGNTIFQLDKLICSSTINYKINQNTLYIGDYIPIELYSWAKRIAKENNNIIWGIPVSLLVLTGLFGNVLKMIGFSHFPLTSFRVKNILNEAIYPTNELQMICGSLPYDMDSGVCETFEWINKGGKN